MKRIMISVAIFIATNGFSQMTETKNLATGTAPKWKIVMNIKNGTDTTTYFYYGYQNLKYTHITDVGAICTDEKKELIDIANGLKTLSEKENGVNIELKIGKYTLSLYDFSNNVYIEDEDRKYTNVSKKIALKMANEFTENAVFLRN